MFDESRVLSALMAGNALYGETFTEETNYTLIQMESEKIEKLEKGSDNGVALRVINPWKTFLASTNSQDEAHLVGLAKELVRSADQGKGEAGEGRLQVTAYPFRKSVV